MSMLVSEEGLSNFVSKVRIKCELYISKDQFINIKIAVDDKMQKIMKLSLLSEERFRE